VPLRQNVEMLGIFSFSEEKLGRVKVSKMSSTPILSGKKQVSRKHVVAAVAGECVLVFHCDSHVAACVVFTRRSNVVCLPPVLGLANQCKAAGSSAPALTSCFLKRVLAIFFAALTIALRRSRLRSRLTLSALTSGGWVS
jgi:hypothetical protein